MGFNSGFKGLNVEGVESRVGTNHVLKRMGVLKKHLNRKNYIPRNLVI